MDEKEHELFRFGSCELMPSEWTLRRNGEEVESLNGQDFRVLCCLVENAPRVVKREKLITAGWGEGGQENYLDGSIHRLREILGNKKYIRTIRGVGHKLTVAVTRDRQIITEPASVQHVPNHQLQTRPEQTQYKPGHFSKLGAVHVHVDGKQEKALVDRFVRQFDNAGSDSKKSVVVDSFPGPQRRQDEYQALYRGHTPGIHREELDYFSTHLFVSFTKTKRELGNLLKKLKGTEGIVIEVERIIQKISESNGNEIAGSWIHEYPALTSGDVGYEQCETGFETGLVEIHYACDIPWGSKRAASAPFSCEELVELSGRIGIDVGGWFRFNKSGFWAYRSNMFAKDVPDIDADRNKLKEVLAELGKDRGFLCEISVLAEQALGVWKTPLKECDDPRTVVELSDWEGKFPDLRDFWVVTPNFLGDRESEIEQAMIQNLQRGVNYTYFLTSVADYMRLRNFAERLSGKVKEHVNVDDQIRAVMLLKDVSNKSAFDEVFHYRNYHGSFIANALNNDGELNEDADGYELVRSSEPGKIAGGRTMEYDRLKRIVELLRPLISDRSLQGLRMPPKRQRMESVIPIPSMMCIELRKSDERLAQLMSQVENETVGDVLTQFDLLIATEVSKLGGRVIKSIEPGYLLAFDHEAAAIRCADQILSQFSGQFNSEFRLRIAIDRGDAWRLMRAHGNDYCGFAVARCRELLLHTEDGQITTTGSFARALARADKALGERLIQTGDFVFDGVQRTIRTLQPGPAQISET